MKVNKGKVKISCLPRAGNENPYQLLMMKGLASNSSFQVEYGIDNKFYGLLKTAYTQKPDYIHLDWEVKYYYRKFLILTLLTLPCFFIQVILIKFLTKTKIVWTPHNITPHNAKHLLIHRFCRRFLAKRVLWIRIFSEVSIESFSSELNVPYRKFIVIPEGDYTSFYPNEITQEEGKRILNISLNKKVLLYFGMIRPYKGILELVKTFQLLKLKDTVLVIAGFPRDKNYLKQVKEEAEGNKNIYIYDMFIKDSEVQVYFNSADVIVLPFNKVENSGTVILSMGFKKPVVAPFQGTVKYRLVNQSNLLFKNNVAEVLKHFDQFSLEYLSKIGERNYAALKTASWENFQKCFR